tara:strand:- start:378 stop:1487 length:1110 start_codon:yes stop_codon:yes gene_type:complete
MGLLGADPSRARADAFLRSLGAMAPGLLMAGAPSTDPSQRGKGLAMAFGAQPQAFQQDLARQRAANVQNMNLEMARAKAAREKALFNQEMLKKSRINQMLGISSPQTNVPIAAVQPAVGTAAVSPSNQMPVSGQISPQPPVSDSSVQPLPQNVLRGALFSEKPGDIIAEHYMRVSDPKLKMLDGQLTGLGKLEQEDKLRGELKPVVTAFGNAQRFFNIVDGQLQKKNGTADIAGLNAMIKMIDAGMVTVGEVDLQREAQSTISRIQGAIAQFKGGRLLDSEKDELRTNMRATAKDLLRDMHNAHKRSVMGYKGIADRRKLDWRNIWTMKGVFKGGRQTTGTGNNAVLKPRPNRSSINTQLPNLEPTEPG